LCAAFFLKISLDYFIVFLQLCFLLFLLYIKNILLSFLMRLIKHSKKPFANSIYNSLFTFQGLLRSLAHFHCSFFG
jgi:hypothetical protein